MPNPLIAQADAWAAANDTGRSEAIRRLVELGLTVRIKPKQAPRDALTVRKNWHQRLSTVWQSARSTMTKRPVGSVA